MYGQLYKKLQSISYKMAIRKFDCKIYHHEDTIELVYPNSMYVTEELKRVFSDGKPLTVEFRDRRNPRSLNQNSLIHKYFDIISDETGNSLETVKNVLKKEFLTTDLKDKEDNIVVNPKTGTMVTYIRGTSDLSTIEMATFTEEVRLWAMDFGIYLPLPEEIREINFKK